MGGSPRSGKRPRPSYEEGQVRDPALREKLDPDFRETDLTALIKKAVKADPKG